MELMISDKYKVESIPRNIVLKEKKVVEKEDKEDTEYWMIVGYYANLELALTTIVDLELEKSEINEYAEIVELIKETKKDIIEAIKDE